MWWVQLLNSIVGLLNGSGVAGGDFESIATVTVGAGGSFFIEFSSIPSTYTHLQIRGIFKTAGTGFYIDDLYLRLNSDSGSNYARHALLGTGSAASATGGASSSYIDCGRVLSSDSAISNTVFTAVIDIHDYASTSKYKTVRSIS